MSVNCAILLLALGWQNPLAQDRLSVEQEVADNILNQNVGAYLVRDLNLPEAFIRRAADRIIRASYHQRYHVVVPEKQASPETQPAERIDRNENNAPPQSNNQQSAVIRPPGALRVSVALGLLVLFLALVISGKLRGRTHRS